jgi:hypothetical protein
VARSAIVNLALTQPTDPHLGWKRMPHPGQVQKEPPGAVKRRGGKAKLARVFPGTQLV